MCGFFKSVLSTISMRPYTSTTGHRNAQRGNAVAEVLGDGLEAFSPSLIIPKVLAQTLISGYSIFRQDTYASEKAIHIIQGSLAATQLGLAITLLFNSAQCVVSDSTICQAVFLTQLLYKGTLLVGWVPSEFSKDPYTSPATPTARAPQALIRPTDSVSHAPAANEHEMIEMPAHATQGMRQRSNDSVV